MFEQRLRRFFEGVGAYHASNILRDLEHEMPLMRRYPEIVVSEIGRFRSYLVDAPSHNLSATFQILHRIAREVPEARDRIIRDLGDVLFEYKGVMDDSTNAPVLTALLDTLELPISERDGQIKAIARSIVTLKQPIILVIGAGFSYDRMPVTSELGPLLVPLLKAEGITNPSEFLRTHDKEVWQIVKRNARSFKERFIGWSARAVPSSQHSTAVEMLHDGRITHLISFNWDDLLERSYTEQYGEAIPKVTTDGVKVEGPAMWKLHGDVEQPSEDWVFPYEDGRVFKTLMESLEPGFPI